MFAYDTSVDRLTCTPEVGQRAGRDVALRHPHGHLVEVRCRDAGRRRVAGGPAVAYDEAADRTVVFNRVPWTAYDATTDRWEVLADADPDGALPSSMVYDSVNRRLVGLRGDDVLAFDTRTREWTVLLEARTGQPAVVAPSVGPAFACPPGSTPDQPGPVAQARPPAAPWSSTAIRGGSCSSGSRKKVARETWTFDVCTNTWTRMHPNRSRALACSSTTSTPT